MAKSNENFLKRSVKYIKACTDELRYKVTWPTSKELFNSSVIVLVASVILSLFIFLVDQAFEFVMEGIYKLVI